MVIAVVASSVIGFSAGYVLSGTQKKVTLNIVDDYGRTVELHGIPQRIVSVAPSPTEILFAVGAGSQVVGVDNYSDYPAQAKNLPQIGSYTLNIEVIMSLKPDLIVSSDLVPRAQLDQLEAQGVPYFIFATRTMEDVIKDLRLAGSLTGHSLEAESLVAGLQARINAVTNKTLASGVEKIRTYIEYYPLWTYGPGSFGNDIIRLAGGANIASNASSEYPELTTEYIIAQDPQVIIYTTGPMTTTIASDFAARSGWSNTYAVSHDKIYSIDDNLVSRYGPRVVDGLEQMAEIIHPELFT
ncbi:MAG: cobalamin-binding protein [Methanomassiliicoccales archaeon]|nr:cobalamin-binding protein [Methanomassiliicoccales archaeon]